MGEKVSLVEVEERRTQLAQFFQTLCLLVESSANCDGSSAAR